MNAIDTPLPILREFFGDLLEGGGSVADIVAPDADIAAWRRFLDVVVPEYPHAFSLTDAAGNETTQWPIDRSDLLRLGVSDEGPWPALSLQLSSIELLVLMFGGDHVEIVLPRKPYDDVLYSQVSSFMCRAGDAMGVDVFLTPESNRPEAALVYEHGLRSFRQPLHGAGLPSQVRLQALDAFRSVLHPLLSAPRPMHDDVLRAITACVEGLERTHGELSLQDALRSEERQDMLSAWSCAASILTTPPGVSLRAQRPSCEESLVDMARRIVPPN